MIQKHQKPAYAVRTAGILVIALLAACGKSSSGTGSTSLFEKIPQSVSGEDASPEETDGDGRFTFLDANGTEHRADINPLALAGSYDADQFVLNDEGIMTYTGDGYTSESGIDVSDHNGAIDWKKVKKAGCQFAFLRIGYRGYTEGGLVADSTFAANKKGCEKNHIPYGVYFFSQAVTEAEAAQEAAYVLKLLDGTVPELPVVYDPEYITDASSRTRNTSGNQFTLNALAFCDVIRAGGCTPGIYMNITWQFDQLDMAAFNELPVWVSDYQPVPQSPYHFEYWQYSYQGTIDGIPDSDVDLDIRLIPAQS